MELIAWQTVHIINTLRGSLNMSRSRPKMLTIRDLLPWFGKDDED